VIFDLSVVTDTLTKLVTTAWPNAPLWTPATPQFGVNVTGLSPEAIRQGQGAQLCMYLYHIDENNAQESLFWNARSQTAGGPPIRYQPLALDLYYLLSAFAEGNYVQEQQAMSIAMRVFHENPVVRGVDAAGQPWEVTLTLERRSYDELSRLWQATTSALRVSAVYRAAVVLIEPELAPPPGPPVSSVNLAVEPDAEPRTPALLSTQRQVSFTIPSGNVVTFAQDPATAAAGQDVWLVGTGLDTITGARLILTGPYPGNGQSDVTAWLLPPAQPPSAISRTVRLPGVTGAPPAGAPPPGRYRVRMEVTTAVGAGTFVTAEVPLTIAAAVDAAGGAVLPAAAQYVIAGSGFTANATQVLLGTVPLQVAGGAPGPGEFSVGPAGTAITLVPPAALPSATYQVRVRVAGIESDPAHWLVMP
jgi:hypothetical protein